MDTSSTSDYICIDSPAEKALKPIQIIIRDSEDKHKFRLNDEGLRKILLEKSIKDLPIAVLSVAGAFRKGKSFLINLFMNHLKNLDEDGNSSSYKPKSDEEIPMLFSWRGGTKRDTTGILAWPEIFKLKNPTTGKDFALLILDTQGTFDDESSVRDNATIFALACMTSSKIIYNLTQQLQEDNLQHLALFTNYGKLALEAGQQKPFQSLSFLIRDWQVPYEYAYGRDDLPEPNEDEVTASGNSYLKKKLRTVEDTHKDLESVREHVRDCFENTECFLLPHPGLAVASSPKFNGQVKMIERVFLDVALDMCKKIQQEIKPKRVNGTEITSGQLLHFFNTYASIFENEDLPEPKSMLQATAEATLLSLSSELKKEYDSQVNSSLSGSSGDGDESSVASTPKALNTVDFNNLISNQQSLILTKFDSTKKLGDDDLIKKFRDDLLEDLKSQSERFREQNENRRLATSWKTPATLVLTNILAQIIGFILRAMFLGPVAGIFSVIQMIGWLTIGVWSYGSYTEQYQTLRERIDELAEVIGTHLLAGGYHLTSKAMTNPQLRSAVADLTVSRDKKAK